MDTTKVLADPVTGESLLAGLEMAIFSLYPHTVREKGKLSPFSSSKGHGSHPKGSTLMI